MEGRTERRRRRRSWRNSKACRMRGGRRLWRSNTGNIRMGYRVEIKNAEDDVRPGPLYLPSRMKTPNPAAPVGTAEGWKSCFTPSSLAHSLSLSHLFSHIWMWFLVIFQALWNDSQTEGLRNYALLPEHDTRIRDVAADKVCTDK